MDAKVTPESSAAKRNRRTGQQRREKTLARLINSSITVVSRRGLDAPVIDDFILAADISRGSFYNYFKTKDELIQAIAEHLQAQMLRHHDLVRRTIQDPAERLVWGARRVIREAEGDPQLGLLLIAERRPSPFDLAVRRGPKHDIRDAIAAGQLPRQNLDVAVDFAIGAIREAARGGVLGERPKSHAEQTAIMIVRGLGMDEALANEIAHRPFYSLEDLIGRDADAGAAKVEPREA